MSGGRPVRGGAPVDLRLPWYELRFPGRVVGGDVPTSGRCRVLTVGSGGRCRGF
ncbi:hypothetical protein PAI11_37230 [Patulibacter medicamentivorans]|uniref:Uncharacterized protein n=1 Tax=Patulibacter medicamentivorans TaxID=1097667 RepID=H0EA49_9ACTN|nr:hypothetical protein PAI11_37230 [Patulibacter medicamentivorans]